MKPVQAATTSRSSGHRTVTVVSREHDDSVLCEDDDDELYIDEDELCDDDEDVCEEEPVFDTKPNSIPNSIPNNTPNNDDDGCTCLICQEPLRIAYVPPCGHPLCGTCANQLFKTNTNTNTPVKCPQCRKPVHQSVYSRCQALEKAALKVYPLKPSEKTQENYTPKPIQNWTSVDVLSCKVAEIDRRIDLVVKTIMKCIKKCCSNSSALILDEGARNMELYHDVLPHQEICMLNLYFFVLESRITEILVDKGFIVKSYIIDDQKMVMIEW